MFLLRCFAIALCSSAVLSNNFLAEFDTTDERLCNPSSSSFRFSGLRAYSSVVYGWPVRHYWSVIHCNAGEVTAMQYYPCNRTSNFMFANPLQLDNGDTYIFSRKKKYSMRNVLIYRPFVSIGAVYQMNTPSNTTKIVAPLQADNSGTSFSLDSSIGPRISYTPLFYAPFDSNTRGWESGMEINSYEVYEYLDKDKNSGWYRINSFLNSVDEYTYVNDRLVFWEFDSLDSQIEGADWRKIANAVVPNV